MSDQHDNDGGLSPGIKAFITVVAICILAVMAFFMLSSDKPMPPPPNLRIIRIHGSDTIGEELMPELIRHFFEDEKIRYREDAIPPRPNSDNTAYGRSFAFIRNNQEYRVEVECNGSGAGVKDLIASKCDIAMSSTENADAEKAGFLPYMIANDALCLVVNKDGDNNVTDVTTKQIKDIYNRGGSWKEYGGADIAVVPFNHIPTSGTRKTFEKIILQPESNTVILPAEKSDFYNNNRNLEESHTETLKRVAKTRGAIGYVGLSAEKYIRQYPNLVKLKLNGKETTRDVVKNENYLLGRRLFLYAPDPSKQDRFTKDLREYILGRQGQAVVASVGFADRTIEPFRPDRPGSTPPAFQDSPRSPNDPNIYTEIKGRYGYQVGTLRGFNFGLGGGTVGDIKTKEDLPSIVERLNADKDNIGYIYIFGHTDNIKGIDNQKLSTDRANAVKSMLTNNMLASNRLAPQLVDRLQAVGCADRFPVNDHAQTEAEYETNRRVEIFITLRRSRR